jgi:PPOX class probable FMN-dependent enzyme
LLLATSAKNGRCDVAPKGDPAGFVRVLDDKHLVIPDRPGNKRFDGLRNILENPHIGLIFLVPGRQETLRVNGRATRITRDEELLDTMLVQGKRPWFALGVEVEECFLQCAKALVRSKIWEAESWPDLATVPTGAELLRACPKIHQLVEEIAASLAESLRTRLY